MSAFIPNQIYQFTPPEGSVPIRILGLQDYSPGQNRKVDAWRIEAPPELAVRFGNDLEFDTWKVVVATLARMFCDGDEKAVSARMVLKHLDSQHL